jgi:hypothetical protein
MFTVLRARPPLRPRMMSRACKPAALATSRRKSRRCLARYHQRRHCGRARTRVNRYAVPKATAALPGPLAPLTTALACKSGRAAAHERQRQRETPVPRRQVCAPRSEELENVIGIQQLGLAPCPCRLPTTHSRCCVALAHGPCTRQACNQQRTHGGLIKPQRLRRDWILVAFDGQPRARAD